MCSLDPGGEEVRAAGAAQRQELGRTEFRGAGNAVQQAEDGLLANSAAERQEAAPNITRK